VAGIRESFRAKLLTALLGTVGLLLVVTYAVVKSVTDQQVEVAADRASTTAARQFRELEDIQQRQVARVAGPLTQGIRIRAALDDAVDNGDPSVLADLAVDQLVIAGLDAEDVALAFTDPTGTPVLTLRHKATVQGADPLRVHDLASALLDEGDIERPGYRVLDGQLFAVRTRLIQEAGRPIGTLTVGLPVEDASVEGIGAALGVEVCVVVEGGCVAGTEQARGALNGQLVSLAGAAGAARIVSAEEAWSVRSQPLVAGDPAQGARVVAVPLSQVTAPFRRITSALLLGGAAALLLAIVISSALSRGLTRPVRALVAATGRVAAGDYETEVTVDSRDELGKLAGSFNDMTRGLLLKERYRSVLDKVVSRDVAEQLVEGSVELGGENRRVSVLFADIRGFTALTEGMEPQAVIGFLNSCMQRLSDAVDAEGGVVDKFIGDEIMAVFGAPAHQADHAARAVRAAARMQEALKELNRERQARGEPRLGLGVGINSGDAVAGNMGSKNRLNYTVLGTIVNLASRLCVSAGAGEILLTRSTLDEAGPGVRARSMGGRSFKGFSHEVEVFALDPATFSPAVAGTGEAPRAPSPGKRVGGTAAVALVGLLALPPGASAQRDGWPTLADAGLGYFGSGTIQVALSGQLDGEVFDVRGQTAGLARGSGWFAAPRLRLLSDVFVGDHLYGLLELRGDRGEAPVEGDWGGRVEQAFLRVTTSGGAISLQAGRFASPFGSYAMRHLTPQDPFVRPPLPYDYRTLISRVIAPPGIEVFRTWIDQAATFRPGGAPPIWGVPYQWGAMAAGKVRQVSYRIAAMNSAPSSDPSAWDLNRDRLRHPSWVAGVGAQLSASLSVGASWDFGPYLEPLTKGTLPSGKSRFDYVQDIRSVDATWARGASVFRAEITRDRWQVPNLPDDPVEVGYSAELQRDLGAGISAALRWGLLDFRPLGDGTGGRRAWDNDVARYEGSLSYRLAKNAGLLASYAVTDEHGPIDPKDDLVGIRLWWSF
jgi:adenylate cyclase